MKLVYITTCVLVLLGTTISLRAQDTTRCNDQRFGDALLEKIIGTWQASGEIGGDRIGYRFMADWELGHQFMVLTFADTTTPPQYTAKVFIGYDCVSERYVVHWLDNFGGRFSETLGYGIRSGLRIAFRFEYPDGPFINEFIYDPQTDTWQLHATTKNRGLWVTFGDIFLRRTQE